MGIIGSVRYNAVKKILLPIVSSYLARGKKKKSSKAYVSPPLKSNERLKEIIASHYFLARYASGAVPVAWVTSGAPVELLRPFGIYTIYPENHSALCGAQKWGGRLCAIAEEHGFSQDLCSYAKIDLGVFLSGRTPVGRLPKPDLLFASNNICQTVLYWYKALAKEYSIPLLIFDTPYNYKELRDVDLGYLVDQIHDMIHALQRITKKDFDQEKFSEILMLSKETCELWGEILGCMKATPAPATIFDLFSHMLPVVSLRGLRVARDYYKGLLQELKERTGNGIGAVPGERIRLLWDNIAIWYKLRDLSILFQGHRANIVVATYTNAWAETIPHMDPANPIESLARAYTLVILNNNLGHRLRLIKGLAEEYQVHGIIMHSARSCKPYSVGQYEMARILSQDYHIPCLVLEADIADERHYSEEQSKTRIEAFLESLS